MYNVEERNSNLVLLCKRFSFHSQSDNSSVIQSFTPSEAGHFSGVPRTRTLHGCLHAWYEQLSSSSMRLLKPDVLQSGLQHLRVWESSVSLSDIMLGVTSFHFFLICWQHLFCSSVPQLKWKKLYKMKRTTQNEKVPLPFLIFLWLPKGSFLLVSTSITS